MIRRGIRRAFSLVLRRRDRWEREVEEEIKLHLALRAEQLASQGLEVDEAYRQAVRKFGPLSQSRTRLIEAASRRERTMRKTELFDDLRNDFTFALRTLGRQKAWTTVAVVTLALGIGATTAVFSVVSTLMLHPLAYPASDRIAFVDLQPSEGNNTGISVSIAPDMPTIRDWIKYTRGVEAIEGARTDSKQLKTADGDATPVVTQAVFPTWMDFAGARPVIGRMFTTADIESGRNPILLNEGFWRTRLGASPAVLGQTLTMNDSLFTIVGVAPQALHFGGPADDPPDIWNALDVRDTKGGAGLMMRLRPGTTYRGLESELDSIARRTSHMAKLAFHSVVSAPSQRVRFYDSLVMLAWAVGLVLLVACANVAHLILARAATRQREMAIRAALGAGNARLLRQLLTESLVLSFTGAVGGTLLGWLGLEAIVALRPRSLDDIRVAQLDLTTLGLAIAAAIVCAAVFAVIGVVQAARHSTHDSLKTGSLNASATRRQGRGRALLVISEMALSATLLVGATLLVRSVVKLNSASLGFDPRGLYGMSLDLANPSFDSPVARAAFNNAFLSRIRSMPQVTSATLANVTPGARWFSIGRLEVEGEPPPPQGKTSFIDVNAVKPNYFATMGISLREGSTFTDTTAASHQVIVNDGFARKHWPVGAALGHRVRIAQSDSTAWRTIVGVANDAKTSGPTMESTAPVFYTPTNAQSAGPAFLIRTTGGAAALSSLPMIAQQMGARRNATVMPVERTMANSMAGPRFVMTLLTIFTALALLLAGVGLYGVMAYGVTQRTREIGIRVALGASQSRVARRVLASGATLAMIGAVIGLGAASWATRLITSELYGVERLDPTSFVLGGLVLIAAALVACIVPTRRALAVDPMTAIRAE